mmetsp:Transcript_22572/g.27821  ORF Transcript_22572/g.27821 Transcript_22572/m.27821 type:complete len:208 (-) Transcript_22572:225-848(-)
MAFSSAVLSFSSCAFSDAFLDFFKVFSSKICPVYLISCSKFILSLLKEPLASSSSMSKFCLFATKVLRKPRSMEIMSDDLALYFGVPKSFNWSICSASRCKSVRLPISKTSLAACFKLARLTSSWAPLMVSLALSSAAIASEISLAPASYSAFALSLLDVASESCCSRSLFSTLSLSTSPSKAFTSSARTAMSAPHLVIFFPDRAIW